MKVVVFGDIHQDLEALKKITVKKADTYICHGDLSNLGAGLDKAGKILAPLKEKLWLMPGNNETLEQIKALCKKHGFVVFHQEMIKKKGFNLVGFGLAVMTPFNTPGEISDQEFAKTLQKFRGLKNLCLFLHNPPKDTELDILPNGSHVGSQAIRDFIEREQPIYLFSGHIHENADKVQRIGKTTCFSIGKEGLEIWL